MDVSQMSTQEKSILLARAMGWRIERDYASSAVRILDGDGGQVYVDVYAYDLNKYTFEDVIHDFYKPVNMALAWRVARWASIESDVGCIEFCEWWAHASLTDLPAERAQALWLDKALRMTIEGGLVELEASTD